MEVLLILCAIVPGALCLAFEYYGLRGHVISATKLEQLDPGLSSEKVRELLGKPTTISFLPDGSQSWLYTSPLVWCLLRVRISSSDELITLTHNH